MRPLDQRPGFSVTRACDGPAGDIRCSRFRTAQNIQFDQQGDKLSKDCRTRKSQRQETLYLVSNLLELPYILGKSVKLDGAGY